MPDNILFSGEEKKIMKLIFHMGYWFEDALYTLAANYINSKGTVLYNNWGVVAEQNKNRKIYDLKFRKLI